LFKHIQVCEHRPTDPKILEACLERASRFYSKTKASGEQQFTRNFLMQIGAGTPGPALLALPPGDTEQTHDGTRPHTNAHVLSNEEAIEQINRMARNTSRRGSDGDVDMDDAADDATGAATYFPRAYRGANQDAGKRASTQAIIEEQIRQADPNSIEFLEYISNLLALTVTAQQSADDAKMMARQRKLSRISNRAAPSPEYMVQRNALTVSIGAAFDNIFMTLDAVEANRPHPQQAGVTSA
jgi:hypothetical protein